MDIQELKQLPESELQKLLQETREKLRELRFKSARRELKNVREVRESKRTIAKIMTLLRTTKIDTKLRK